MPGTGGSGRVIYGVGFWAQQPEFGTLYDYSKLFRGHLKSLPDQPPPPNAYQWWALNPSFALLRTTPPYSMMRPIWRSLPDQPTTPLIQQSAFQSWVALYGLKPRPSVQSDWPLTTPPWRLNQTWTQSYNLNLIGQDAMLVGEQVFDLAPSQRPPEQIQLHSWQWSYNLSLIGKDRLPAGDQFFDLSPRQVPPEQIQLHSWSWSYNLNLRGKDQLPVGEDFFDLPPRDPREVRSWTASYILNLIGQDQLPVGDQTWVVPTPPWRLDQTWTQWYNLNLINQDLLPIGDQRFDLSPIYPPYINHLRTWSWQYNLNLIGRDRLPVGEQIFDRPILAVPPAATWIDQTKIQLTAPTLNITISQYWDRPQLPVPPAQAWTWSYNLNLIGQDRFPVGEQVFDRPVLPIPPPGLTWIQQYFIEEIKPFLQSDWPLTPPPYRIEQTWTWAYNKNLIGKDQLPPGKDVWDLAPSQRPYEQPQLHSWQSWYNQNLINQDSTIVGEQVWERPTLPIPPAQTYVAWYNLNLIGQDKLPVGEQSSELPPRDFARLFQTWVNTVNLALVTAPPNLDALVHHFDYPNPRGAEPDWRRSWTAGYNLDLVGQDQLPFRQQDWPLTPTVARAGDWIQQTALTLKGIPQNPFFQTDWPLPQAPLGAIQTWTNTFALSLIGQDKLPFRQSDWPLTSAARPGREPGLDTIAESFNLNLIGKDRLPNRQSDWPLPSAHALAQIPLQIMVQGKGFWLVPAIPLPPGAQFFDRPQLPIGTPGDQYTIAQWPGLPIIVPPPVVTGVPLRTLMGTGV
jgi:hypothetical protein